MILYLSSLVAKRRMEPKRKCPQMVNWQVTNKNSPGMMNMFDEKVKQPISLNTNLVPRDCWDSVKF